MGELVSLGTQEICCHHAQCSFHAKAGTASVAVLAWVWMSAVRHWLLKKVIGSTLAFLGRKLPLPLLFLQLEFSIGRQKHGFPSLIPFLDNNSVGWDGLASYEMRKRTVFLAGSREEGFNLFSVCVCMCACVHMRVYLPRKLFFCRIIWCR